MDKTILSRPTMTKIFLKYDLLDILEAIKIKRSEADQKFLDECVERLASERDTEVSPLTRKLFDDNLPFDTGDPSTILSPLDCLRRYPSARKKLLELVPELKEDLKK